MFTIIFCFCSIYFHSQNQLEINTDTISINVITGAEQPEKYLPLLQNKKVGIVTNQTGVLTVKTLYNSSDNPEVCKMSLRADTFHLVDYLIQEKINITKILSPEHGFRGDADAGETVKNGKDAKTGISIISLYGSNKKPTEENLKDIDILLFDIQDVGTRFYTYISTLHYIMEAAAESNIPVVVLDRPNPNGHYVDGPVLKTGFESFIGMHKVPVVYGMTIGEYAQMINEEKWLKNKIKCELTIIPLKNYTHNTPYSLPIAPSPNLQSDQAINLYPSTCFFEGTNVSEGRGTDYPFVLFGSPYLKDYTFSFIPKINYGVKNPKYKGQVCYGENLNTEPRLSVIRLDWLIKAYKNNTQNPFFNKNLFFDKLAGTNQLRKQIIAGKTEIEIKNSWKKDIDIFKKIREKYLLYP